MIRRARIEKIIDNNTTNKYFTALITWLDMDGGFYNEASISAQINLGYSYISRSFGIQYYPVPGDIVLCGFLTDETPIIISFLSTMYYSKVTDSNTFGYFFRRLVEGEYAIKGLRGNEIYLDRQGSLRFIIRDQEIEQELKNLMDEGYDLNLKNYVVKLPSGVDLTKQVLDYPKTELTIGKVFDEEYKEEQKLNDESLAVQIVGKNNTPNYDDNGNLSSVDIEETYKVQINVEGEISISKNGKDEEGNDTLKYNITIDKEGNISLQGTKIQLDAQDIFIGGEPGLKGQTLFNWCNTHTHSNGNNGSPTGPAITRLPQEVLIQKQV